MKYMLYAACALLILLCAGCGNLPPVADTADEDGNAPSWVLHIQGPGLNINIKSNEACPGDGIINVFGSRIVELPPDRVYAFIYTVSDIGGVSQTRIGTNNVALLDLAVEVPEPGRVSYESSPAAPTRMAVISRGPEMRTALLASGKLYPRGSGTTSVVVDGFDAASNNTFHTITFIINGESDARLIEAPCP